MGKVHPPPQKIAAGAPAEPPRGRPPQTPRGGGPGVKGVYKNSIVRSTLVIC